MFNVFLESSNIAALEMTRSIVFICVHLEKITINNSFIEPFENITHWQAIVTQI